MTLLPPAWSCHELPLRQANGLTMGRLLTIVLGIWVAAAPLALGGNRPLPWAYNAVMAGILAVLAAGLLLGDRRRQLPLHGEVIALPLLLWGLALAWGAVQLLPLAIPGLAHPVWTSAAAEIAGLAPRITVNADLTLASLMRLLTYTCLFLAAYAVARDAGRAAILMRMLVVAAACYAVYGFLRQAAGADKLLWFDEPRSAFLTGPFINRNTAATYFGLACCVSFALVLRKARHLVQATGEERTVRGGVERMLGGISGSFGLELALFILLLAATLLTQSRAGVMATLVALGFGLLLQRLRGGQAAAGRPAAVLTMLVGLAAVLAVIELAGGRVIERIAGTDAAGEIRLGVILDTLDAIRDHAWMGAGLGTFQDVFPLYRNNTPPSDLVWDKAHNDFLEAYLGLGLVAGTALILGPALLVLRCLRGTFQRRRNSHMPMAACLAGLLAGLHALFDFSLQIQAVAMSFVLLLAVGAAQSVSSRKS